ncbi:DUF354 domain-containing protein [Candidatus Omnitrophota bacterium]
MRILVDISHPAHVHFFKHTIRNLKDAGHEITTTVREKDVTIQLLKHYDIESTSLSKAREGLLGLSGELVMRQRKIIEIIKRNKIQLCVAIGGAFCALASWFLKVPCIIFTDTENAKIENLLSFPFAGRIITPDCFRGRLGKKQVRYNGFHELAYLHPNYFTPSPEVLSEIGLREKEVFFIVRFVAWKASHDVFKHGFRLEQKTRLLNLLEKRGRVFITSECPLEHKFQKYKLRIIPSKIHDLLSFATMLVTDSQTMTTEAAVLGTPAIRYNSFVGPRDMGNFIELESRYDLIYSFNSFEHAMNKIEELLENRKLKEEWQNKRKKLLSNSIDVTEWIVNTILSYCPRC